MIPAIMGERNCANERDFYSAQLQGSHEIEVSIDRGRINFKTPLKSSVLSPCDGSAYRFPPSQTTKGILITTPGCLMVSSPASAAARISAALFNSRALLSSDQVTVFRRRSGV